MLQIVNDHNLFYIDETVWIDGIEKVLNRMNIDKEVNIIFVNEQTIKDMNNQFINHDYVTDVISFENILDSPDFLGEIYICIDQAERQGQEIGHSTAKELLILVIHGILHLWGYDDQEEESRHIMFAKQDELADFVYSEVGSELEKAIVRR